MVDVFEVAELLVSHAVRSSPGQIDLVCYYGSYARGTADEHSDLDIFYTPADGTNPPVNRTFLLDGVLFDFWPITWPALEGFASGQLRGWSCAPAIVHHAKALYVHGPEQQSRLTALKQKVLDLQKPEARPRMVRRALDMFAKVLLHLGNLRLVLAGGNAADVRYAGWHVIASAHECLALANQALLDHGLWRLTEQIERLAVKPPELAELIATISTSPDSAKVAAAAERLAIGTRQVLRRFQESLGPEESPADVFATAYPEIKGQVDKIASACRRQDAVGASAATWFLQSDVSLMLSRLGHGPGSGSFNLYSEIAGQYRGAGLPEVMMSDFADLPQVEEQGWRFDEAIRRWLTERGVGLQEYTTLDDLRRTLQ